MIFSSLIFILFFLIYLACHRFIPHRHRNVLMLLGSVFFVGYYRPEYLWIPVFLAITSYLGALSIDKSQTLPAKRWKLAITVTLLLLPLIVYKYTDFLYLSVFGWLFHSKEPILGIPLPIGISFVTFTVIAYVVDVYRGMYPSGEGFNLYATYVFYFPKYLAGPITRPADLMHQLRPDRPALRGRFLFGMVLFSVGIVKKSIFADTIAAGVDAIYKSQDSARFLMDYLFAFYGYSIQIYCDFSGYTDMALGIAFMLGMRLPMNFRQPYLSTSFVDFWRRWHLTLSFWLRDYLYIPLGGSRHGFANQVRNVIITMGLGGLWHGANWTFVVWGLLHAAGILAWHGAKRTGLLNAIGRLPKWVVILITFHFISAAWVFFRAPDLTTAFDILTGMFTGPAGNIREFMSTYTFPLVLMVLFALSHRFDDFRRVAYFVRRMPKAVVVGTVLFFLTLTMVMSGGNTGEFIYFDF